MNAAFKLISEPAALGFGNCVWDLVWVSRLFPKRTESSLPFLYTPPTLHWDQKRHIPVYFLAFSTILIRLRTNKMQTGRYINNSLPNKESLLFSRVSLVKSAFSPRKKCLVFLVSSNNNDDKHEINQIQK